MDRPRRLVGPFSKMSDNNTSKCEITVKLALNH